MANPQNLGKGVGTVIFIIIGVILLLNFMPFGTIGPGERGILLRFNGVTKKVFDEGLYFYIPIIEKVRKINIQILKEQVNANASSKDLQTISAVVALNYHINPAQVARIYQEVGVEYKDRIIDPAMQEAVKASTALFTAEELITKREIVKDKIKQLLKLRLEAIGILVDEFNIVNFEFSKAFNEAIEAKVTAEQSALAARNKLEQVKFEAEQRIAEAKGKAEAIKIEAQALNNNPQVLELRGLEKWDGKLPQYLGSNVMPFIKLGGK